MKIQKILNRGIVMLMASTAMLFCACSDHEEDMTPSYADLNGFAPADNDNSPTAQLRREFFQQTGSYLLFSDTLLTTSSNGKPELLEIQYSFIGTSSYYDYTYDYITDINSRRAAADVVQKYLVKKMGKSTPFSFLLVNDMFYDYYGSLTRETKMLGLRTYAISMNRGEAFENPEEYFNEMLSDIIYEVVMKQPDSVMDPFYAFGRDYYGAYLEDLGMEDITERECWNLGFFGYVDAWWDYFPYENSSYSKNSSNDLWMWVCAVIENTPAEFEETYGSSATMMEKFEILHRIILDLGFVLE